VDKVWTITHKGPTEASFSPRGARRRRAALVGLSQDRSVTAV